MSTTSPLWGVRLPSLTGDAPDVPDAMMKLAVDLEGTLASRGLFADKPASSVGSPGKPGRRWFATDHKLEYLDTGTGWVPVGPAYVGDYKMAARTDDHDAWLRCEGRELSTAYPDLIAFLADRGSPFGVGPNGRPKLPDPAGRTMVFAGSGTGLTARALGATGGEEKHALTTPEMPAHVHQYDNTRWGSGGVPAGNAFAAVFTDGYAHMTDTTSAGSGTAHNNMPPFLVGGSLFIRA